MPMRNAWCVIALLIIAGFAQGGQPQRYEFEEPHMGTRVRITLYAENKPQAIGAVRAAFKRIREIELALSDYRNSSEVMQLCRANDETPNLPRPVGSDLFQVLQTAQQVAKESEGAFDVTVGPLSLLWREARKTGKLPAPDAIREALQRVGYQYVHLDPEKQTVRLEKPGMRLDFGGIGKGYAADQALAVLVDRGTPQAMVAVSGDIAVGKQPPDRDTWLVEIAPLAKGRPARTLKLTESAVSTSGDLFQFLEFEGKRYSHVLDPRTGYGLTGRRSVTVVAPRGILADSLSKVASVLPPAEALAILKEHSGTDVYLVVKDDDDAPEQVTASPGFAKRLFVE